MLGVAREVLQRLAWSYYSTPNPSMAGPHSPSWQRRDPILSAIRVQHKFCRDALFHCKIPPNGAESPRNDGNVHKFCPRELRPAIVANSLVAAESFTIERRSWTKKGIVSRTSRKPSSISEVVNFPFRKTLNSESRAS